MNVTTSGIEAVFVLKLCAGIVAVFVLKLSVGTLDGVLVSAKKARGTEEPEIGMDMIKVRALEETISSGSRGTIETMGSYDVET